MARIIAIGIAIYLLYQLGKAAIWYVKFIWQGGLKRIDEKAWMKWFAALIAISFVHVAFPKTETVHAWGKRLEMETAPPMTFDVDAGVLRALRGPRAVPGPVGRPGAGVDEFGTYDRIAKTQPVVEVWSLIDRVLVPESYSPRKGYYSVFGHTGDQIYAQQRLTCRFIFDGAAPEQAKRVCDILLPVNRKFSFLGVSCKGPGTCYQDFFYSQIQLRVHAEGAEILHAPFHGDLPNGEWQFRQSFKGKPLPLSISLDEVQSLSEINPKIEFSVTDGARRVAAWDERDRAFGTRVGNSANAGELESGEFVFGHANLFLHLAQDFVTGVPRPLTTSQRDDLHALAASTATDYFAIVPKIPNCNFSPDPRELPLFHYARLSAHPKRNDEKYRYLKKFGGSEYRHLAPNLKSKDPQYGDVVTLAQICDGANASALALAVWLEAYLPQPESLRLQWAAKARRNEELKRQIEYEVNLMDGNSSKID